MRRLLLCLALVACAKGPHDPRSEAAQLAEDVLWTQLQHCAASGGTLTKTDGQDTIDDAGAISQQVLDGDGWLEVTAAETQKFRFVGLTHHFAATTGREIDFAFRLQAGRADIYENGTWRADNLVAAGDLLRVSVENGRVHYDKNGVTVWTSPTLPSGALFAAASLIDAGSTITDARIAGATPPPSPSTSPSTMPSSSPSPSPPCSGSHDPSPSPTPAPTAQNRHRFCGWTLATGYVDPEQDPGYLTFAQHADEFDAVHPAWWHIGSDPTSFVRIYGEGAHLILDHTTYSGKRTLLIPMVAGADGNQPQLIDQMLHDPTLRSQHIANLVALVTSHNYDGIDLDYEHLPDGDRDLFSEFAREAAAALHAQGKTLSFAVGGLTGPVSVWDYDALSQVVDQLHVMGYDYHYLGSHPGPVAPLGWVQKVTRYIQSTGRAGRFLLGLPNYGLAGPDSGTTNWFGTLHDSIQLAGANYSTTTDHMNQCVFVDPGDPIAPGRAPNAYVSQGHLFFDDITSLDEKVQAAVDAGMGGVTYWTIGGEPDQPAGESFFQMVRRHYPQ